MRKLLFPLSILPLLSAAPVAWAFDPDTPVGERSETFPIRLSDEESTTIGMAFRAAFGLDKGAASETVREIDGRTYHFRPVALHSMENNVAVLLSVGSLEDAGHSEGGLNAVHYLKSSPTGWVKQGEWMDVGAVGTVGNGATSWAFTNLLAGNPYLVTAGGGVWQGCLSSSAAVTELTPEGPVERGGFTNAMSSGAGVGQTEQGYDGEIVAAVPGKSFTVAYTGTKAFKQQYVLKGGQYVLAGSPKVPGC